MSKADEYEEALARLDRIKAAGKISDKDYEFHKARLNGEARSAARPQGAKLLRFAVIVAAFIGILWLGSMCSGRGGDDKPSQSAMTTEARQQCRQSVKDKLKSPATARFSDESVSGSGPNATYTVTGSVDSENSFGALIRASFSCSVTFTGGEAQAVRVTALS